MEGVLVRPWTTQASEEGTTMTPALLVMAATVTVALPPFAVERAPGVLSQRVPDILSEGMDRAKCGAAMPPARMSAKVLTDFAQCAEKTACIGEVSRGLGVDFVVGGHIVVIDSNLTVLLTVLDVHGAKVVKRLELHYDGKLSGSALESALGNQVPELCRAVSPDWKDPNAPSLDDLSFERPTDVKSTAPPDQPAPVAAAPAADPTALPFDLPSMIDDSAAKAPAAGKAPAVAQASPAAAAKPLAIDDTVPFLDPTAPVAPPAVQPKVVTVAPPPNVTHPSTRVTVAPPPKLVDATPKANPHPDLRPRAAPVHRRPWGAIVGGGALATMVAGIALGAKAQSVWSGDHATTVDGVAQHTITQAQALQGNHYAAAADVLFGVAAAAGVGAGVLIYANGGLGLFGHF